MPFGGVVYSTGIIKDQPAVVGICILLYLPLFISSQILSIVVLKEELGRFVVVSAIIICVGSCVVVALSRNACSAINTGVFQAFAHDCVHLLTLFLHRHLNAIVHDIYFGLMVTVPASSAKKKHFSIFLCRKSIIIHYISLTLVC